MLFWFVSKNEQLAVLLKEYTHVPMQILQESLGIQVSSNTEFSIITISLACSNAIMKLICLIIQTDMLN